VSKIINPKWADSVRDRLASGFPIDETIAFGQAASWLVTMLSLRNRAFKVYNLPCGVKRITTETDVCPCCKRAMEVRKGGKA